MQIKTYSKKELRNLYNISADVFNKWLQEIEHQLPHYKRSDKVLSPAQVKIFIEEFGAPI
jgi:transposase